MQTVLHLLLGALFLFATVPVSVFAQDFSLDSLVISREGAPIRLQQPLVTERKHYSIRVPYETKALTVSATWTDASFPPAPRGDTYQHPSVDGSVRAYVQRTKQYDVRVYWQDGSRIFPYDQFTQPPRLQHSGDSTTICNSGPANTFGTGPGGGTVNKYSCRLGDIQYRYLVLSYKVNYSYIYTSLRNGGQILSNSSIEKQHKYTIELKRSPLPPRNLHVEASNTALSIFWNKGNPKQQWGAPELAVKPITGHDVHYTLAGSGVSNTTEALGTDPSAGWVDGNHTSESLQHTISNLQTQEYKVRVRAENPDGKSDWVFGKGTPLLSSGRLPWAAALIQKMKEWRNDSRYCRREAHTDRWDRALAAFEERAPNKLGCIPAGTSLAPMTASEAQGYADRGWTRWAAVVNAMRRLQNLAKPTPTVIPNIITGRAAGREGSSDVNFRVRLDQEADQTVKVDYMTVDGVTPYRGTPPAEADVDYTSVVGTLVFGPGETVKRVVVPILDDSHDEGTEHFLLRFSNPQGANLAAEYRQREGFIWNEDHLQTMWLSRFGRMVGSHVTDAVSERLGAGLSPGAHATLAGQPLDLSRTDDGGALAEAVTGLARTFGAPAARDDDPFASHGLSNTWNEPAASAPARSVTGRELLLRSSFHLASRGGGGRPGLAAWGRVAQGSFDGEHTDGTGRTRVDGEVVTGVLGADADWRRLLAGVAVSLSEGEGKYDSPGVDRGRSGRIESRLTTVSPYARFKLTEQVSAWSLAGWGTGDMTIRFDDGGMDPIRTDLRMRMGALGARGALFEQEGTRGMDLALKADAFFVRMDSEKAVDSVETEADTSRVRLVLEGGRRFALSGTSTLRPSLEIGVRHDGGDAETGTGFEVGGNVVWADTASGLSIEARARVLAAHADSDYEEWGASATARFDPGERGRGLSFSLSPTIGTVSSATARLWGVRDARGLAPGGGEFEAARGLKAEAGYGVAVFGGRFTGTPNMGFGVSDGGARDWRMGWRLTPAVRGRPGLELDLDATRREPSNDNDAEHGVTLRAAIRW